MKIKHILPLFISTIMVAINSCKHDPIEPELEETTTIVSNDDCDPNTVYFQNEIFPLIQSSCAIQGCHDAISRTDDVDLTTYIKILDGGDIESTNPNESELYRRITETEKPEDRMPPLGYDSLSAENISKIRRWIEQGYQNNSCNFCDTNQFTFSATIQPLIDKHCKGCHSGSNARGQIYLTNYNEIKARVDDGYLLGTIRQDSTIKYRPMPDNQPKLSDCKIRQIEKWVAAGAQNN